MQAQARPTGLYLTVQYRAVSHARDVSRAVSHVEVGVRVCLSC